MYFRYVFLLLIMITFSNVNAFVWRFNLIGTKISIKLTNGHRLYVNGDQAKSCFEYKNAGNKYLYAGDIGDGIYSIKPDNGSAFDVYCDMSNGGFTEIFDLNRTPGLTINQVVAQLQNFNSSISLNVANFGMDTNGLYWVKNNGAIGASIGVEKINFSSVSLNYMHVASAGLQGLVVTSLTNIENCSSDISIGSSCFNLAYKFGSNASDYNFQLRDFTTGNTNWNEINYGVVQTMSGDVSSSVSFLHPSPMFITMVGRTESSNLTNTRNYIKFLKVK